MVSVCTVPARGGRSCEHFGGYKTLNRIPLPLHTTLRKVLIYECGNACKMNLFNYHMFNRFGHGLYMDR